MSEYKVLGTDHSAFTVSDMERSVSVFSGVLGFEVVRDAEAPNDLVKNLTGLDTTLRMVYLRGPDGHQVELLQYHGPADKQQASYRPCDTAAAHIAIRVDNVPAAVAAAEEAGLERLNQIITAKRASGTTQSCYLRDPDGITIEILSRTDFVG